MSNEEGGAAISNFKFQLSALVLLAVLTGTVMEAGAADGKGASYPQVSVSSRSLDQGGVISLRVGTNGKGRPVVIWMNREIHLAQGKDPGDWRGFLGADLKTAPGIYPLIVRTNSPARENRIEIRVREKDYGERRLTLPREMVDLDAETLERVRKEAGVMKAVLGASASLPQWSGLFLRPVEGEICGPFGRRSIINGQPRSPHSGVDLRGGKGTPVKAVNDGRVALTCEHFFSGLSVVIDHGGGIQSMYFHLDSILVRKKQFIKKGEVLGDLGATGRATGPHLHFAVRVNGARVDPLRLIELSSRLE
ncbi:MAG: M23 family metallopeptidase [Deltaproteobacteria bacterium]|nr:M23 family metallopeptidase [Deltaproteobacteria bacterium]